MLPSNQDPRGPGPPGGGAADPWLRGRKLIAPDRYRDGYGAMRPMTSVDDTKRTVSRSPAGLFTRSLRPYAEIFRIPGAWGYSDADRTGRMPISVFGLGTVLLIAAGTGRYGVAGTVSAVGSLGYAVYAPRLARLVDDRGQRRVLLPLLAVFALAPTSPSPATTRS